MSERLGRYQIIRPLASGGMGDIFLAEHTGLSGFAKRVVVKRIRPSYARDPSYLALFLNEARVGSFLNHPNIVHIFDVGHEADALWLVMEYVDGVDLKRLLRRAHLAGRPLAPTALAAIMVEVLSALEEAHAGGPLRGEPIIHRDVSPENVLVARSGAVKVLDFGLAKWAPGSSTVASMEGGLIFGKIRYMPPEQLRGHAIDVRADLFALGVVMYETLTNTLPFGSDNANAVLGAILRGRPRPATERHPTRDKAMDAIIFRAMEPEASNRYPTATAMRAALVDYLERAGAKMPLEEVRRLLRAPEPRVPLEDVESQPELAAGSGIDLGVAKRCGKCGGTFEALYLEGMILDRCRACHGVWLDHGEIERLLGIEAARTSLAPPHGSGSDRAPLDALIGSCPTCKVGLRAFPVPGSRSMLELCPSCVGAWFDRDEMQFLARADVAVWLRKVISGLRAPSEASAPTDP